MTKFPEKLLEYNNWICHKKKVPKNPITGKNCVGKYENWGTTYKRAMAGLKKFNFDGPGFVFKESDPFCGIDLDGCIIDGEITQQAKNLVEYCNSYTEISMSGTGLHIICEHNGHGGHNIKEKDIEIYTKDRFFVLTGALPLGAETQDDQQYCLRVLNPEKIHDVWSRPPSLVGQLFDTKLALGGIALLIKRMRAKSKFKKLWAGDISDYGSHSEADLALCSIIAYYTNHNREHIDQIFRMSKLFRPEKWDRRTGKGKTYGSITIDKALEVEEDKRSIEKDEPGRKMRPMVLSDFMTTPRPEIKTIMSPWLTMGSTHMIYGPRGAGKTFFALSLAMAITTKTDFGTWAVNEPVNCLYCDGEMMPQDVVTRIKGLQCNVGQEVKKLFILSSGQLQYDGVASVNVSRSKHQKEIYEMVVEHNIGVLFLDNISALTPGIDENISTEWDNIAQWANIVKRTGCSVVFIHHAGKAGTQRGTSGREDMLESVLKLKPVSGDAEDGLNVFVMFEKSRHIAGEQAKATEFTLVSEPGDIDLKWGFSGAGDMKRGKIIDLAVAGHSYREIADELRVSQKTIIKNKKYAIDKGWIQKIDGKMQYTIQGQQV
jgi:KaiC/GvpD/RAD55 family RecA-like ATPase